MRISTSTFYNESVTTMNQLQAGVAQTTQQIATGRRILSPADDPAGAALASELTQTDAANTQLAANRTAGINTLSLAEGILQSVSNLLLDAKDIVTKAGNGNLNDVARKSMATDLSGRIQELLGLANSTDGAGNYLFSGSQGKIQPFVSTASGVVYQGDDVQRKIQAAASRQISTTDSGADIFMRVRTGNGTFQTSSALANTGGGTISQGLVIDSALYNGNNFQIAFTSPTSFDINDLTTGLPVSTANTYVSGQAITFNGIQLNIQGAPASGDKFNVDPSINQSVFDTLNKLVATLNTSVPSANAMNSAVYRQGLSDAFTSVDQGLNTVLGVRATMGSRLRELDALQLTGEELGLQYKSTLSKVQDTDYNRAISDLTQQQMTLSAAQKSFAQVSKMSLFDYL
ncbi:MAG: flagellar hook-associated protein FlgL [Sideroxydans sp.]|nr:flagellar hook-associated protein FlgL [Sideroxydans sp.]